MFNKSMHRAFFVRSLATFLIPMLIPLLVLGTLFSIIIQQYVKEEINRNNSNLLKQTEENITMFFDQLDSLNMHAVARVTDVPLKRIFQKNELEANDYARLDELKQFIDSPAVARPYIESVYLYLKNDKHRLFNSTDGRLVKLDEFYDRSWFDTFLHQKGEKALVWTEPRTVRRYEMDNRSTYLKFISMYKKISVSDNDDGVIVLNIKRDYIQNYLAEFSILKNQSLLIIDKNEEVIFKNNVENYLKLDVRELLSRRSSFFPLELGDDSYIVSMLSSEKYGWRFFSIVPKASLYELPTQLSMIALGLLIISLLGGIALAYQLSKKGYDNIKTIISLLHSAEKGIPLSPLPRQGKDVYSYITQSIVKNFIEQNYLKVQLSEQKYKMKAMEFSALQSQLNPHFLFNTLGTIYWKAASLTGGLNSVNKMIENLSDILRFSLNGENKLVTLQDEITYTISYIDIQKVRYKDTFDVIWKIEDNIQQYKVMKLFLQPLIENSLYHGIKEKNSFGSIKIKMKVVQSFLHISVTDNGNGMTRERLRVVRDNLNASIEQTNHIGLLNTHRRLKLTFGEQYGLLICSKFRWGTSVHLTIPITNLKSE
ncbi:sensor histidine kinase [uncultured Brevibacillus sp.]|uniref:sensor histidine kinase n=1 Tax=uncultured Brevibacillus sp. TaxID=169970 RepID=UPI002591CE5E|nr:sensor histidine kinase [uncultured Brevibacillus sp.]